MADGRRQTAGTGSRPEWLTLFCDGASFGNPGPAGAGFVLVDAEGRVVASAAVPLGRATNNVAEYRALIAGLHEAAARGARRVSVRADSELVVRQLQGRYRVKAAHLAPLHDWARKLIARFDEVTFQSVPRDQNSEADRLAREGAERSQQAGAAPTDPPRHARRNRDPS